MITLEQNGMVMRVNEVLYTKAELDTGACGSVATQERYLYFYLQAVFPADGLVVSMDLRPALQEPLLFGSMRRYLLYQGNDEHAIRSG